MLHWRSTKPLPDGLLLDPRKGIIRGVPSTPGKAAKLTIIASNSRGEASSKCSIQVPTSPDLRGPSARDLAPTAPQRDRTARVACAAPSPATL